MIKNNQKLINVALGKQRADLVIKNAKYLNVYTGEILQADIAIKDGYIAGIGSYEGNKSYYTDGLVVPGFIDGHVHIESSMALPSSFAIQAFKHGTTTVICDPHEIANVAGEYGIRFMIEDSVGADVDFKFMLPSCVPSTPIDESYKRLGESELRPLYKNKSVIGLAEVMDVGAVISGNEDMMAKINYARSFGKAVDGHAPILSGNALNGYVVAGIRSDHECTTYQEGLVKLRLGQYIMVRQGTAAHNLKALKPLVEKYPNRCMFVTDDMHPELLLEKGHVDRIIREAVALGVDMVKAITCATLTPSEYFGLSDRGAIAPGLRADLAVLDGDLNVIDSFSGGSKRTAKKQAWGFGGFNAKPIAIEDLYDSDNRIISLVKEQLITNEGGVASKADERKDIVKLFAYERHHGTGHKASCYLSGYGLKKGAIATSIAHDSHNIIAAGYDEHIVTAVNELIKIGGGIVVTDGQRVLTLPLEVGGIMSSRSIESLAHELDEIKKFAFSLGVTDGVDPFMTLSFLSLPVIPSIRLLPSGVVTL